MAVVALAGFGQLLQPRAQAGAGSETEAPADTRAAAKAGESASSRVDRLCRSLTRIVASEIRGFADLRGEAVDDRLWQGREVPPPMYSCTVEGSYYPGAEYVCRGAQSWRGRPTCWTAPSTS